MTWVQFSASFLPVFCQFSASFLEEAVWLLVVARLAGLSD